jgi:ABC-2 type transport system ATP-binding protein
MIRFLNLKKKYFDQTILDISFCELANELIWLKGINGSGKTTLLKIASGMIPFEGDVEIGSMSLKKYQQHYRQMINYAEAEPLYPGFLSGLDLINFHEVTRQASREQTERLISLLGIGHYYKNKIGTYSSGMVKRLSLVLAFMGTPKLILLDEPLVTLDVASQQILYRLIGDQIQQDTQLIFTSHQALDPEHLPPITEMIIQNHQLCEG